MVQALFAMLLLAPPFPLRMMTSGWSYCGQNACSSSAASQPQPMPERPSLQKLTDPPSPEKKESVFLVELCNILNWQSEVGWCCITFKAWSQQQCSLGLALSWNPAATLWGSSGHVWEFWSRALSRFPAGSFKINHQMMPSDYPTP